MGTLEPARSSRQVARPSRSGHVHIEENEIWALAAEFGKGCFAVAGLDDGVAFGGERGAQHAANLRLVVDH